MIAFYCPGSGLTAWDRRTGGAPLGNFWPLGGTMELRHNGVTGVFHNSEAAYQSLKWWQHEPKPCASRSSCCTADDYTKRRPPFPGCKRQRQPSQCGQQGPRKASNSFALS